MSGDVVPQTYQGFDWYAYILAKLRTHSELLRRNGQCTNCLITRYEVVEGVSR